MVDPLSTPQRQTPRSPYLLWLLYLVIFAGCVLRVWETFHHNPVDNLWSDSQRYWDHAKEPLTPSPMAVFDPPLYQIWVSVVEKLSLAYPPLVAFYAALLSVLTPWVWYRFLRETLSSRTLALIGWAALAWLPTWINIYSYMMSETLLLTLLGASLWATMRAQRKQTVTSFTGMAVMWTLAGLTRGIAFPLGALACLWVWLMHRKKLQTAFWSGLCALVLLAPLAVRNNQFVSLWEPWGNGWLTSIYAESARREILLHLSHNGARWEYGFTSPSLDSRPLAPFSDWTPSRVRTVHVNVDLGDGAYDWKKELEHSRSDLASRLRMRWENALLVMLGESWPDNNRDYFMGRASNAFRWPWIPLLIVVVAAMLLDKRAARERPLLPALIIAWFLLQAISLVAVNEGRYRKPVEGLLIAQTLVIIEQTRRRKSAATDTLDRALASS